MRKLVRLDAASVAHVTLQLPQPPYGMARFGRRCGPLRTCGARSRYRRSMEGSSAAHAASEFGLGPDPNAVGSLAVILPPGLASVVDAVPALRHLRITYSHAVITAIAGQEHGYLLDACPYVDRRIDALRPSELAFQQFDLAVSLADPEQVVDRSPLRRGEALDVRRVDAVTRAAYRSVGMANELHVHPVRPMRLARTARMLRLVWLLGGSMPSPATSLWATLADRTTAARLLDGAPPQTVVLHPFTSSDDAAWPRVRWESLVRSVVDCGACPVLVGTDDDPDAGAMVAALGDAGAISLVGVTTVGALVGVLERAMLFVGTDSGPAALARALGVPSVVMTTGDPIEDVRHPSGVIRYLHPPACGVCSMLHCEHGREHVSLDEAIAETRAAIDRADRTRIGPPR